MIPDIEYFERAHKVSGKSCADLQNHTSNIFKIVRFPFVWHAVKLHTSNSFLSPAYCENPQHEKKQKVKESRFLQLFIVL